MRCERSSPLDQLHDQGDRAVALLEPVDGADVRMVQRREHLRLAPEARQPLGVVGHVGQQYLQRDVAIQLRIARAVHRVHAALAEQR